MERPATSIQIADAGDGVGTVSCQRVILDGLDDVDDLFPNLIWERRPRRDQESQFGVVRDKFRRICSATCSALSPA